MHGIASDGRINTAERDVLSAMLTDHSESTVKAPFRGRYDPHYRERPMRCHWAIDLAC